MGTRSRAHGPRKNQSLFPDALASSTIDFHYYESVARERGYRLVAGVDEVGRGPLAGPVVAAAVILHSGAELAGITDSKKMSEEARETAFDLICREAVAWSVGVASHRRIDRYNILEASLEAMKRAVSALSTQPDFLLVDGIHAIPVPVHQWCIKKGDVLSKSISAASVMAKVYRDRILRCYHAAYPAYGFDQNKGYGTRKHLDALSRHGPCPVHRLTFKGVRSDAPKTRIGKDGGGSGRGQGEEDGV